MIWCDRSGLFWRRPHTRTHARMHARSRAHTFNGPLSGTTQVSLYQKGKTSLDFAEARDSEWQWHQLGHMQVCTSLQTDKHTSTPPLSFYRPDALPAAQPTASKHWRQEETTVSANAPVGWERVLRRHSVSHDGVQECLALSSIESKHLPTSTNECINNTH